MSQPIGIKAIRPVFIGRKTPVKSLPEYALLKGPELEYFNTCGIESVYDAEGLQGYDLSKAAAEALLSETGIEAQDIDVLIYIRSRIPSAFISSEATRLQHELGLTKALTFSVSDLGCADSSLALKLAKDWFQSNPRAKHVMIAYGHRKYAPKRYRYPVTIQGDGGIAALVGRGGGLQLQEINLQSNGNYADLFSIQYLDRPFEEYEEKCSDPRKYGFELAIESRNRYQEMNSGLLSRQGLTYDSFAQILMQNIAGRAFDYYENAFNLRISPVCRQNLAQYGHLGCADILLNLHTAAESGLLQNGDKIFVMNNSPVAAWSNLLIQA